MTMLLILMSFTLSLLGTIVFRRYALEKEILDIPNQRSSHSLPTPRGGGIAFVGAFIFILLVVNILGLLSVHLMTLIVPGVAVAVAGLIDDKYSLDAKSRIIIQGIASAIALYGLGGMPNVMGWPENNVMFCLTNFGAWMFLIWMTNLYNFMDGIDGLAAMEAVTSCLSMVLIYWLTNHTLLILPPAILAAAVVGFLCLNLPPAKIFMGDVGSAFLGMTLGVFALQAGHHQPKLFWAWLAVLAVFIGDATFTLLRRASRGEKLTEAHCSHLYQRMAKYYQSHGVMTVGVLFINVLILLPLVYFIVVK